MLTKYQWDIVVADDEERMNETLLLRVNDNGSLNNAQIALPPADGKYYYGILRGSYTYGTITKESEFITRAKYLNV